MKKRLSGILAVAALVATLGLAVVLQGADGGSGNGIAIGDVRVLDVELH
ncbi:hypothetical protein [Luteimonas sp. R10]|nr:hypothetical protein U3649_00185 [Luteimonas sp. R10]